MLLFWVAAAALSLVVAAIVVAGAARAARAPRADPTLNLYRRQMGEIEDLVERGLLDEAERRSARAEAGRRLIAAADTGAAARGSPRLGKAGAAAAIIGVPAAALLFYLGIGSPGLPDQPFANRIAAWRASDPSHLNPEQLAAVLEAVVQERPGDVEGLRFLAQAQIAAGDPFQAAQTARRALALQPDRTDLWLLLGMTRIAQADGKATADAEAAFLEALERDPASLAARYYVGRARIEAGDAAAGLAQWRTLLAQLPADEPGRADLEQEIATVERTGRLAPPAPAPTADDAQMQAAVRGMVEGLATRLQANPDDPEGWVRLVRAYSVLGETARRDAALATARARYADRPDIIEALTEAAKAP